MEYAAGQTVGGRFWDILEELPAHLRRHDPQTGLPLIRV
jgi:hypothetical protein